MHSVADIMQKNTIFEREVTSTAGEEGAADVGSERQ